MSRPSSRCERTKAAKTPRSAADSSSVLCQGAKVSGAQRQSPGAPSSRVREPRGRSGPIPPRGRTSLPCKGANCSVPAASAPRSHPPVSRSQGQYRNTLQSLRLRAYVGMAALPPRMMCFTPSGHTRAACRHRNEQGIPSVYPPLHIPLGHLPKCGPPRVGAAPKEHASSAFKQCSHGTPDAMPERGTSSRARQGANAQAPSWITTRIETSCERAGRDLANGHESCVAQSCPDSPPCQAVFSALPIALRGPLKRPVGVESNAPKRAGSTDAPSRSLGGACALWFREQASRERVHQFACARLALSLLRLLQATPDV